VVTSIDWTLEGQTVKGYTQSLQSGQTNGWDTGDLQGTNVTFYYIADGKNR